MAMQYHRKRKEVKNCIIYNFFFFFFCHSVYLPLQELHTEFILVNFFICTMHIHFEETDSAMDSAMSPLRHQIYSVRHNW